MWLMTEQEADRPQVPGHGSTHREEEQASVLAQSELRTHSGRQPCRGSPSSPGGQEQEHSPPWTVAMAPGPQELGSQVSRSAGGGLLLVSGMRGVRVRLLLVTFSYLLVGSKVKLYSPGLCLQEEKGSPTYPSGQLQMGL